MQYLEVTAFEVLGEDWSGGHRQEVLEGSIPSEEGRFKETEARDHVTFLENCQRTLKVKLRSWDLTLTVTDIH